MVGDGAGVVALDHVFHVSCFVCATCGAQLRGQHFYAVERRAYCEHCYVVSTWGSVHRGWGTPILGGSIQTPEGQQLSSQPGSEYGCPKRGDSGEGIWSEPRHHRQSQE